MLDCIYTANRLLSLFVSCNRKYLKRHARLKRIDWEAIIFIFSRGQQVSKFKNFKLKNVGNGLRFERQLLVFFRMTVQKR